MKIERERFTDDKRNPDQEKAASSEEEVGRREDMSGRKRLPDKQPTTRKAVEIHRRQEQAGSRESGSIRQGCREKEMSKQKRSQKLTQPTAVPARRPGVVPIGSPFSL